MSSAISGKRAILWSSPFSSVADGGDNRGMSSPWAVVTQPHLLLQNRLGLWAMQRVCCVAEEAGRLVYVNLRTEHSHIRTNVQTCCMLAKRKNLHTHTAYLQIHPLRSLFLMSHPHKLPNGILTLMWGRGMGVLAGREIAVLCALLMLGRNAELHLLPVFEEL